MKKKLTLIILLIIPSILIAQNVSKRDSLINIMCKDLQNNKQLTDSLRIEQIFTTHLYSYLVTVGEKDVDSIYKSVFYRFQTKCPEFLKILQRIDPGKSDWNIISSEEKPISSASKKECRSILKFKKLYYLESNGDQTFVQINRGKWVETFTDQTFSKLKFNWISDCKFELEFLESNNETRGNMSKIGDKYYYEIITKETSFYSMSGYIPKGDIFMTFKIYYD